MKKNCFIFHYSCSLLGAYAKDETFKQDFKGANTLIEEKQFKVSLPIWLKLQEQQPRNSNLNYKVGLCYMNSANNKIKSLPYFSVAIQNTTKNYNPYSYIEKKAPVDAFLHLAKAHHYNYDNDKVTRFYQSFKNTATNKHYLYLTANHSLEQCENAKSAVANPVNTKIKNMCATINSPFGDYSPVIPIDESSIYFTSRIIREDRSNLYNIDFKDRNHFEDIYVSNNYENESSKPTMLNINTDGPEAVERAKRTRRLVISIKSSASKVPSETFKTNDALAYKIAIDASRHIKSELISKGISSKYIIFKIVDSSVNGPKFNIEEARKPKVYEKYQYVTITIK